MEANIIVMQEAKINERHVWLYKVESGLSNIFMIEYEQPSMELECMLYNWREFDKAEKKYKSIVKKMLAGK